MGVILCHMKLPIGEGLLKKLLFYGYSGVDVFLLLSGYGLYVSLSRSDDLGGYLCAAGPRGCCPPTGLSAWSGCAR